MPGPRIFISAGEASGDLHGAALIRALRARRPDAQILALGGPRMQEAGARLLADTTSFGIIGVAPLAGGVSHYLDLLSRTDRVLAAQRVDVAVVIDCPGFHFLLGSRLRARRIPALWYIPPQVWAWAPWRVRKLARRFSHVACVLPHEKAFFEAHGVPVTFVGHPVVDHLRSLRLDEAFMASLRPEPDAPLVAIFPGSRRQEVAGILRRQLSVARALAERRPRCTFVCALAHEAHAAWAAEALAGAPVPVRTVVGKTHEVQKAADLALAKSGTTTLELLYYGTPMAVFYNIGWAEWHLLGRWMINRRYRDKLSLPNALAGRTIVPESMHDRPVTSAETSEIIRLLTDPDRRRRMQDDLAEVRATLDRPGAAARTADLVLDLAGTTVPPRSRRPGFAM
ncbi:MAG: lipid-A-disaccharide synthase [Planctomycetes bacterium]|nr:lipid-A-disaccharide synthase [Planctomycetota bacterium]